MKAQRSPLYPPSGVSTKNTGAFLQTYENFSVFWILKAGHMVYIRTCIFDQLKYLLLDTALVHSVVYNTCIALQIGMW